MTPESSCWEALTEKSVGNEGSLAAFCSGSTLKREAEALGSLVMLRWGFFRVQVPSHCVGRSCFKWGLQPSKARARAGRAVTKSVNPPAAQCSGGHMKHRAKGSISSERAEKYFSRGGWDLSITLKPLSLEFRAQPVLQGVGLLSQG